ncbi:cupin-like domain-containing protein [Alternaria rosae]|uniref:cupin-like domain-containing protein n=1 Tax=Alternaria rosae TaxID=1187941 RepID=UPI001E8CAD94|nr:cupin-like domain-containing protein [Alternaria rosae]KAH6860836.1 cupin-like domain-containing protein [Alternaria rosae]
MPKPAPVVPRHWSRRPDLRPTNYARFRILTKTEYLDKKKELSIPKFDSDQPALFKEAFQDIPAIGKWFKKDAFLDVPLKNRLDKHKPNTFGYPQELNTAYLEQYGDAIVPLELTRSSPENTLGNEAFERFEAPLALLLQHMSAAEAQETSLYLAQHSLADLPAPLQKDLPTPSTFLSHLNARGDIYASSLWMGRPPTRTPLHRDPNPNLFVQLAGKKTIRMMAPEVGRMVFETVRQQIQGPGGDAKMRGEEMMQGAEMEAMETAVWNKDEGRGMASATGWETTLRSGDALYIPNGWWHAVRGIGKGANASANWWFR